MRWLVVVLACVAVLALVAWFITSRQHPEQAATHADAAARPGKHAGPDAETMSSDRPGGRTTAGSDVASGAHEPE